MKTQDITKIIRTVHDKVDLFIPDIVELTLLLNNVTIEAGDEGFVDEITRCIYSLNNPHPAAIHVTDYPVRDMRDYIKEQFSEDK